MSNVLKDFVVKFTVKRRPGRSRYESQKSTQHSVLNKYCQMVQHGYFELRTGFRCLLWTRWCNVRFLKGRELLTRWRTVYSQAKICTFGYAF